MPREWRWRVRKGGAAAGAPLAALALALALASCKTLFPPAEKPSGPKEGTTPLPVKKAPEEVVVAAWAEPKRLPEVGGQAQILIRAQKRGGAPFEGVEVRIRTSTGSLFSKGRVLTTDGSGRTRDRLTTRRTAIITVNAGGTVYRFRVPLGTEEADEGVPP